MNDYRTITIVDPRYYNENIEKVIQEDFITDVMYLYNTNTFVEDTSLADVWVKNNEKKKLGLFVIGLVLICIVVSITILNKRPEQGEKYIKGQETREMNDIESKISEIKEEEGILPFPMRIWTHFHF